MTKPMEKPVIEASLERSCTPKHSRLWVRWQRKVCLQKITMTGHRQNPDPCWGNQQPTAQDLTGEFEYANPGEHSSGS